MVSFTESPYEYMMAQKPDTGRRDNVASRRPPDHKCCGCPYGRERPCVGICIRDLYSAAGKKAGEADAVLEKSLPVPDNKEMS